MYCTILVSLNPVVLYVAGLFPPDDTFSAIFRRIFEISPGMQALPKCLFSIF